MIFQNLREVARAILLKFFYESLKSSLKEFIEEKATYELNENLKNRVLSALDEFALSLQNFEDGFIDMKLLDTLSD